MAYEIYLKNLLLPVAPESINISTPSNNKRIGLVSGGEFTALKKSGLREISFKCMLPNTEYKFAQYVNGFAKAEYFITSLRELKENKESFQFIVIRKRPDEEIISSDNITAVLEDFDVEDSVDNGFDVNVNIKLKEFIAYKTEVEKNVKRNDSTAPIPKKNTIYKVKSGDSLWGIAKKFYGDGNKWPKIYEANKSKISNPDLIKIGQEFVIPVLK